MKSFSFAGAAKVDISPLVRFKVGALAKRGSIAPQEIINKSLKMIMEHGQSNQSKSSKRSSKARKFIEAVQSGSILKDPDDDFFDEWNAELDKEQEEMPWIEKIADDRTYR